MVILFSVLGHWHNADKAALVRAFLFKLHRAGHFRKQGIILATSDIGSRVKSGAALTNQNITCQNLLATESLDAKAFGF